MLIRKTNNKYNIFCNNMNNKSIIKYGTLDNNHKNKIELINNKYKNLPKLINEFDKLKKKYNESKNTPILELSKIQEKIQNIDNQIF